MTTDADETEYLESRPTKGDLEMTTPNGSPREIEMMAMETKGSNSIDNIQTTSTQLEEALVDLCNEHVERMNKICDNLLRKTKNIPGIKGKKDEGEPSPLNVTTNTWYSDDDESEYGETF